MDVGCIIKCGINIEKVGLEVLKAKTLISLM